MKKILIGAVCAVALSGILAAEDSGVFVGVSYQGGQASLNEKYDGLVKMNGTSIPNQDIHEKYNKNPMMNGAGIKLGYKQFFGNSKWFGLRYYAFLDYGYANFGKIIPDLDSSPDNPTYKSYYTHMLSYGVGIDTLWNFINKDNASFGIFAGIGVGADTWIANGKDFQEKFFPKGKVGYVNFQATIDAGLRTNLYKHHGFEVGVKVPLLQDKIFNDKDDTIPTEVPIITADMSNTTKVQRNYSVYVSYLYTF
ncbi:hypothetical protein BKH41_07530 [Helicobacter sp. 12S02232-10]|uniref:outer membrane protein n=1 Tax=Helicobacter sp. 12S02232-10 TaxID=1476197 RepID=UPI000BA5CEA7|nr:outer membrane protein [Helicobacter sp. 12S02232-10]PAF47423.1 hypothetical protein BKH41_07530 [Helicobacter sp. 12S02232-10]